MSVALDDVLNRITKLSPKAKKQTLKAALDSQKGLAFVPNPGPQTDAYFSKADVLLYGGEPGGGKTGLLLGLAFNAHKRSLIMRRQYSDLGGIIEQLITFNAGRNGFSEAAPPKLRRPDGRYIELGGAARVGDEQHRQGDPHDFIGFDEGTQFAYSQVRFLMGWLRSADRNLGGEKQRTRVVIATNPPLTAEGLWIIEMFAPWLDDKFPHPAMPGELRWVVTDENGRDQWVNGPEPVQVGVKLVKPLSRSFIPASVSDNPFLAGSGYEAQLDAMIEPYRSILMGKFKTVMRDADFQVIPTAWIRAAQARWRPQPPDGIPMCAIGVDASGGGDDPMIQAIRHDAWYAPLIETPGKSIPMDNIGPHCAGIVVSRRRDNALVIIDMGGGYGGSLYDHLKQNHVTVQAYKGAEASTRRTSDRKMGFTNTRSAAYWQFREALDPSQPGGSPVQLPDDPILVADLTAPTFEITPNGVKVEPKEKITERLGRSTDRADAVVMAWYAGPKEVNSALEWTDARELKRMHGQRPKVLMGRNLAKRR